MSAEDALLAMQAGEVPARLHVEGDLHFYRQYQVAPPRALPAEELVAESIVIHDASQLTQLLRIVRCHNLYLWDFRFDFSPDSLIEFNTPAQENRWSVGNFNLHNCAHVTRLPQLRAESLQELRIDVCPMLEELPAGLRVNRLAVSSCPRLVSLPADLQVGDLEIMTCPSLSRLPDMIHARRVSLARCEALTSLPDDCAVSESLNLSGCTVLTHLPENLGTLRLTITGCRALTALPERLAALYITMDGCVGVRRWDDSRVTSLRQFSAWYCGALESLPPNLRQVDELDIRGCTRLTALPEEIRVTRWLDIGGSGVSKLPASAHGTLVRWNGVNVTAQIAFHPETLTTRQVLGETNAEVRRIMLERLGAERFLAEAHPEELDADTDTGGARRLLRIEFPDDEPFVVLEVRDPSTGRQYLLRVPPTTLTCRGAAAWIAGFDDPADYHPIMET